MEFIRLLVHRVHQDTGDKGHWGYGVNLSIGNTGDKGARVISFSRSPLAHFGIVFIRVHLMIRVKFE